MAESKYRYEIVGSCETCWIMKDDVRICTTDSEQDAKTITDAMNNYDQLLKAFKKVVWFYGDEENFEYKEHPDGLEGRGDFEIMKDLGYLAREEAKRMGVEVD